jgi:hypothetical protein
MLNNQTRTMEDLGQQQPPKDGKWGHKKSTLLTVHTSLSSISAVLHTASLLPFHTFKHSSYFCLHPPPLLLPCSLQDLHAWATCTNKGTSGFAVL